MKLKCDIEGCGDDAEATFSTGVPLLYRHPDTGQIRMLTRVDQNIYVCERHHGAFHVAQLNPQQVQDNRLN